MSGSMVGWVLAAAVLAGLYLWYATIVTRRNKALEALSSIDVHLRQRHDLIPNIVKLAGRYLEHERGLIADVTRLRARAEAGMGGGGTASTGAAVAERFALENELAGAAGRLLVAVEAYPELKADGTIAETQRTWVEVEAQITAARRFYNAAAASLKNAMGVFPGGLLAAAAGVTELPFFETPPATREAPDVDAILGRG